MERDTPRRKKGIIVRRDKTRETRGAPVALVSEGAEHATEASSNPNTGPEKELKTYSCHEYPLTHGNLHLSMPTAVDSMSRPFRSDPNGLSFRGVVAISLVYSPGAYVTP